MIDALLRVGDLNLAKFREISRGIAKARDLGVAASRT